MSTDTHTQANRQTDRHTYTQHVGPLAKCHFICIIGVTPIYPFHSHTTTHTDTYTKRHAHIRAHTHARTRTHPHDNCKLVSGGWEAFSVLARVYQTHNVCTCHVVFAPDFVSSCTTTVFYSDSVVVLVFVSVFPSPYNRQ